MICAIDDEGKTMEDSAEPESECRRCLSSSNVSVWVERDVKRGNVDDMVQVYCADASRPSRVFNVQLRWLPQLRLPLGHGR